MNESLLPPIAAEHFPRLGELEVTVALDTCKSAGAMNAAVAIGKHLLRVEMEEIALRTLVGELSEACRMALPYVQSQNEAEHMLDGFGPRQRRRSDDVLDQLTAVLAKADKIDRDLFIEHGLIADPAPQPKE